MSANGNGTTDTVIIGGGQAGLVTGYLLQQQGRDFVILDAHERVGDAWRTRWDSLRLFTPAKLNGLPGMKFPAPPNEAPTKDEMADYLESYAERFDLPVRCGARVERVRRDGQGFEVSASGTTYHARNVIVASGGHHHPSIPSFASDLDPSIVQLHSKDYKNRSQLQEGPVLLVGAGNSGADIAMDLIENHPVILTGRSVGHIPFRIDTIKARFLVYGVRFAGTRILNWRTPVGRKVLPKLAARGNPLVRVKPKDLLAAGVERVTARVTGVQDGKPVLEDGRVLDVANVIWCTGFRPDWSWLDLPSITPDRDPDHERGVVSSEPGLYFVGLRLQNAATSDTITGVPRDAKFIVEQLARADAASKEKAGAAR